MSLLFLILFSLAFILLECLLGGTRLLFGLPGYLLIASAAVLTLFSLRKTKIQARPSCLAAAGALTAYIAVRASYSPVTYLALPDFFMVLAALCVYLLAALHIVKSKQRMFFFGLLLLIAIGQTMLAARQFSTGTDKLLFNFVRYNVEHRASGQYVSPNHLAGFLEVVAVMGLSLVIWGTWKPWVKIVTGYVSLVSLAGVAMTGSRGGYVSTVVCLLTFCALSVVVVKMAFPERLLKVVLVGGALLLVVCAALPLLLTSQLVRSRAGMIFVKDVRLKIWPAAWEEAKQAPVFGVGGGTFLYYGRKYRDPDVQTVPTRVHNDYLDMAAEYGIVGLVVIVVFVALHVIGGLRTFLWLVRKRLQFSSDWRSNSVALNIGCLCAVAAYIVHSVVDFNLHIPANALMMAFIFGVLANPGLETFHAGKGTHWTNLFFRWVLPALGLAMIVPGARMLPGEYYSEKARTALRDNDYAGSIAMAKAGIAWETRNPDLYYYLGEANRNIGGHMPTAMLRDMYYSRASDAFKQGLALFPQDVRLLLIEGWTADALGRLDEGDVCYNKAMEWDPRWGPTQEGYRNHQKILEAAAKKSQENQGAPGVDGAQ